MVRLVRCFCAVALTGSSLRSLTTTVRQERGQLLVFATIILAVAPLLTFGILNLAGTSFFVVTEGQDWTAARYAAGAGATDVLADLIQGKDVLTGDYTVPTPTVNSLPVLISIAGPNTGTQPTGDYRYVDPGVGFGLKSLSSQTHYFFRMDSVNTGKSIRVNWAFTPQAQRWKIKLYSGLGPPGAAAPVVIAQDNFESGDFTGGLGWATSWAILGQSDVVSKGSPYEGSFHARLRRGNGRMERTVDLTGRTNVRLQFYAKASSFEAGETATCSVSPDGASYTVVRLWSDGEDDDVYRFEDIDISSFSMTSTFAVVCQSNMSNNSDIFYVDDLKVVSQPLAAPIAQMSSTKGPGSLFVDGSLMTGGAYTLDFLNDSGTDLVSEQFSTTGDANSTWIFTQAFKDYVITSTADEVTVKSFVRQIPGPTSPQTREDIVIYTWNAP